MLQLLKAQISRLKPNPLNSAKEQAWSIASEVTGYDPKIIRKDICGAWIVFSDFQNQNSQNGWDLELLNSDGASEKKTYIALQWRNKNQKQKIQLTSPDSIDFCIVTAND